MTAFSPIYFSMRKDFDRGQPTERNIYDLIQVVLYSSVCLFFIVVALFPTVVLIVTPERFHGAALLIPVLAFGFMGQMIYNVSFIEFFYLKKTYYTLLVTGLSFLVNVFLSLILVDSYGAIGVSWAYSCGLLSSGVLAVLLRFRFTTVKLPLTHLIVALLLSAITYLAFANPLSNPMLQLAWGGSLVVLVVLYTYRKIARLLSIPKK